MSTHHNIPLNDEEEQIANLSDNHHIADVLQARLARRQILKGGVATAAGVILGGLSLSACGGTSGSNVSTPNLALGFDAVAKNKNDRTTLPDGYQMTILHALGDPMHYGDASWKGDGSESADSYNRRIGDGHDGMYFFGLSEIGAYQSNRSDRGLLCVNHEYVVEPFVLHPVGRTAGAARVASEAEKEIYAHGVSIVEIKRDSSGTGMTMVRGSQYNRRITSATEMVFSGAAKGSDLLKTKFSADGTRTRGTNNNCANGYTPWGTYLTCEENYANVIGRAAGDDALRTAAEVTALNRYGMAQGRKSPYLWDTAGSDDLFARWSASVRGTATADDYRNAFNTFGWVVEIDPFSPESTPVKHTALGRFSHEGAWPSKAVAGKPLAWYMGEDARNEYIYKFVSAAVWDPADIGKGLAAGAKYMDEGTLYVAKFNDDGSGQWLELTYGKNGLDASNTTYPFANQADVLVYARLAADSLGATKMDRPEWGAVNPNNGEVYMSLTNNNASNRVAPTAMPTGRQARPDAANPRYYDDGDGNKGNPNGHIIRWRENGDNVDATTFKWDIYLFGAENDAAADVNLSGLTEVNDFSSPDGLFFDPRGMLWIETDDSAYTDVSNCMLLAALPGQVGDGGATTAVGGTQTVKGANATAKTLRRFLVGPKECEITGVAITPDYKTLFVNVQHPGEDTPPDWTNHIFGSHWPASQTDSASTARPRSATMVITRKGGGMIGV